MQSACPNEFDEEYPLAAVEALLAGTLALMTGYAQHQDGCDTRPLMAHKLVHNLLALRARDEFSASMQTVLTRLTQHWTRLEQQARRADPARPWPEQEVWPHTPVTLQ